MTTADAAQPTGLRIHVFQHADYEGPGHIAVWATHRGHLLRCTHWYAPLPQAPLLIDFDLLIVLGGSMNVDDEARYPWLITEKALIRAAVAAGKPVLGICLGSQLLAGVLGAAVGPNTAPEIGFF